jgi:hypothetical protein
VIVIGKFTFILPKGEARKILLVFSFNITKDLMVCGLDELKLRNLILEDALDKHTNLIGDLLYSTKDFGIRKIRLSKGKTRVREEYGLLP